MKNNVQVDAHNDDEKKMTKMAIAYEIIALPIIMITMIIAILSFPLYIFSLLGLLFQWANIADFSKLSLVAKTYMILASSYFLYMAPLIFLLNYAIKKNKWWKIIPCLIILGIFAFVWFNVGSVPMSER